MTVTTRMAAVQHAGGSKYRRAGFMRATGSCWAALALTLAACHPLPVAVRGRADAVASDSHDAAREHAAGRRHSVPQTATRLRVEYLNAPIAIDEPAPRFSWALQHPVRGATQAAYNIRVWCSSTPASRGAASNATLVWDSGRVAGNGTLNIAYAGEPLVSDADYVWSIVWWDAAGNASIPASANFSTALLNPTLSSDWHGAEWLQGGAGANAMRAEFNVSGAAQIVRARLYVVGLGYWRGWLNGQSINGNASVLGSFTTFQVRLLYDVMDVTTLLAAGCNALGIMLGDGWYAQSTVAAGPQSLLLMLSVATADGRQVYFVSAAANQSRSHSDYALGGSTGVQPLTFAAVQGPVTYSDIYNGEAYDARLLQPGWDSCAFDNGSAWQLPAQPTPLPLGVMSARTVPIAVDTVYAPISITQPVPGAYVVDFGQNMAGLLTIAASGPAGTVIQAQMGEILHADGTVQNQYAGVFADMHANFTLAGTGSIETYTTLFSYFGFRYAQVTGWPGPEPPTTDSFAALFIHSGVDTAGSLTSDNAVLNALVHNIRFASLSNLMDVPTDCPQRERRGWLGDAQLSAETVIHNVDAAAFYTKFLRDIQDAQGYINITSNGDGALPDCVPWYHHGFLPGDVSWTIAYPNILSYMQSYYSDVRVARHYPNLRAYVDFLMRSAQAYNGTLLQSFYGDW